VVISGYMQTRGQNCGLSKLWRELYHRHSSKQVLVVRAAWDDSMGDLAEMVWRETMAPQVAVYAYSWGGPTAMNLARQLGFRGIGVDIMVLSDPVYRNLWKLWRVFFRWPKIKVPPSVTRVRWFRQYDTWPFGHELVPENPEATDIRDAVRLYCSHAYMDDADEFQVACHEEAALLLR